MKKLIVAADDFGLTKSINEGIVKAHKEGIVRSINFLPAGEAFGDALDLAKDLKLDGIGAHLSLTEIAPVTDPRRIPTLIARRSNRFYKDHNSFFFKFMIGFIRRGDIYTELESQLIKLKKTGMKITNLSSHEHIHMLPEICEIFARLAKEHDIPAIRYPHKESGGRAFMIKRLYRAAILSYLGRGMKGILDKYEMIYPDHFLGFLDAGRIGEGALIAMIESLGDGTTELVCHPGFLGPEVLDLYRWHINCEEELFALTSPRVKKMIEEEHIKLISYQEFLAKKP